MEYKNKKIIGLIEKIAVFNGKSTRKKEIVARIDTGATASAIDARLAAELQPGPIIKTKVVKSSLGTTLRPVIELKLELAGKTLTGQFTVADRSHLKYRVLIGQNLLKDNGFLIDPDKRDA